MGKRKHKSKDPEKIRKKIRRLERLLVQSDSSDSYAEFDYESDFSTNRGIQSTISLPPVEPEPIVEIEEPCTLENTPAVQSNDNSNVSPEVATISADILEALGQPKNKTEIFAPKIRDEVSERWGKIVVDGLSRESIQKLIENILIPENFKLLKAPVLNQEIGSVLTESTKKRDSRLEKAQNHLGKGISAIPILMSTLIDGEMDKNEIIKKLSEVGQVLLDLHCQNTLARRKLITFSLDKKFLNIVEGVKRDSFLFGENLGDKIKANQTAVRSGLLIKRSFEPQPSTSYSTRPYAHTTRPLNSRGLPRTQVQRGKRGGPRYQASPHLPRRQPVVPDRYKVPPKAANNKPNQQP